MQKTSCVMEAGSFTIFLCALFIFDAEGAPVFAEEPKNPFLAVEGDNVTLEWRYSFGKGNSLSQMLFEKEWQIVDNYSPFLPPWIKPSYRGHILVNITNYYTSIILLGAKRTDEGSYKLTLVSSKDRERTESNLEISILFKPEVTIDGDQEQYVAEGSNVRLICRYDASPPVSEVQWIKDRTVIAGNTSRLINDSRVAIPSFNGSQIQLSITAASREDGGNYTCSVTNILNSTQDTTLITIEGVLEFTEEPKSPLLAVEGDNVTLEWRYSFGKDDSLSQVLFEKEKQIVDKYSPLRPPWIKSSHRGRILVNITNDYTSIILFGAKRTDEGNYKLTLVSSKDRERTESELEISILFKPEVTIDGDQEQYVAKGSNIRLICRFDASPPVSEVQWIKDGTVIAGNSSKLISDSRLAILSFNGSQIQLSITAASRKDGGNYTCSVTNILNSTRETTQITIEDKPEIITHPHSITTGEGQNLTLYCNATGNPLPTISWCKDGYPISNGFRIILSPSHEQLKIRNVNRIDRGDYKCLAKNRVGTDTSNASTINVQFQPEISIHPRNVTIVRGDNVTFSCSVVGNPTPSVVWTKDGEDLDVTANGRFQLSSRNDNLSIEIGKVHLLDSGQYRCVANNSKGKSSSSAAKLTVQYVPDPPKDVKVISSGSREINISWTVGFDGNSAIQNYTVKISEDKQTFRDAICQGTLLKNNCVVYSTRVSIKKLFPWTTYYLRVFARNMIGSSHYSSVINVTTDEEVPSSAPPFNVTVLNSTAVHVFWQMLAKQDARGAILGYYILYKRKSEPKVSWKNKTVDRAETTSLVLASLDEYISYQFSIQAFNRKGVSSRSEIVERKIDGGAIPDPPQNITVDTKGSRVVNISWTAGYDGNRAIENFIVEISDHDQIFKDVVCQGSLASSACVVSSLSTTASLTGLFPRTTYNIRVFARNKIGRSSSSPILNVTTDEAEPSHGAGNVSFSEVNYTTNRITWAELPKEAANGVIKLYEVRLELKESCLKVDFTFHAMNTTKTSVLLTGFWMCAKYEVSVRGYTVAGPGPYSKAIVVQTKSLKLSQTWSKETPSPPSISQIPSGEGITANITLPRFPGNAKFFQVIVIRYSLDYTGVVNSAESFTPKDLITYEEAHKSPVPAAYVTFQFRGQDFDVFREFVVGDGGHSSSKPRNRRGSDGKVFLNKSLQPNTNYRVFLRAFVEKMVYFSSNFVTIETKGEPTVKDLPERTIFQVGDVVVLTCEATGDPKPSVTWSKDGNSSIPRAQFRNDDRILVIQEVASSDGGIYECRASNIFGQRRTATAVIIAVPPSIMKDVSPRSVLCAKETSCSLLCHATSDILFNHSWTRNGQALDGHNIKVMNNSVIITPLDDQDFGDYVCHATNSFGSTTYKITLSESKEEENNVQSIFRTNDIVWSWIVFLLLVLIGVLIWRLRRAQASNRLATAKKATIKDTVQSVFPLEQHASEPGSYMELRPRPSEGQTRLPAEYQSLQGSHVNAGYYNVVPKEGNKRGSNEEIYEEIELSNC